MTVDEISALPVCHLCAADCVLALWTTQTHILQALAVMQPRGFAFNWQFGTGYQLRSAAQFFLIGTRGRPLQLSRSSRNLIVAPVQEHSCKPDEMLQPYRGDVAWPCVEPFARRTRAGWYSWIDGAPHLSAESRTV
jgi:N6-adenosine-specific RNA methylase IME4